MVSIAVIFIAGVSSKSRRQYAQPARGMNTNMRRIVVLVWDLPTRLFHWLTVVLVAAAYLTWRLNWMDWHALAGEALLALVLFRVAWGLVGSETARFARFLASPRLAVGHLSRLFHREPDEQLGHNPAGGWIILLFLALLLGEALTGVLVNNDVADEGPLTELLPAPVLNLFTDLHAVLWDVLLVAMVLHVAAIATYAVAKGQNLVWPMLTGRKRLPERTSPPRLASHTLAVAVLAGSAAAAALLSTFL
jgi:cytochrome b